MRWAERHRNRHRAWAPFEKAAVVALLAVGACAAPATGGEDVATVGSKLLNQDTFLYLRCNATGFGVDETTRLRATNNQNVVSLTFNVTQSWMLATGSGDQCILSQTNQLDGWGTNPTSWTDTHPATALLPPANDTLVNASPTFLVKYPALGQYQVLVNWATKAIEITPAKTVNVVGHVATASTSAGGIPLPGVTVTLTGPVQTSTTVTDANGNYLFATQPGSYTVAGTAPSGSTLSPSGAASLGTLTADAIQDFACSGTCLASSAVVTARELMITDPTVVNDPIRTSNASNPPGPWSFRAMIENMLPAGTDSTAFTQAFIHQFDTPTSLNGFPVEVRKTANFLNFWPKKADGKTIDVTKPPFQLLAIVNRVDVGLAGNGEGRFVFGLVDGTGVGQRMTVIFEYGLPSKGTLTTRQAWAAKFHTLGPTNFGPTFNTNLQAITDVFATRGSSPSKPGGSSINQVRTNEIVMSDAFIWQLREFHLTSTNNVPALTLVSPAFTPEDGAVTTGTDANTTLVNFINGQSALIHGGFATAPASVLGGQSTENFLWSFSQTVNENARHDFAGMTCNGCHNAETNGLQLDGFYQISPVQPIGTDGTGRLSAFITQGELPRRSIFLMNQVGCSGATCASGAPPMVAQ